jgi:heme/copper-type cytochrome/quinol oxidase subunit 1
VRRWLWVVVGVASMGLGAWMVLTTSNAADFGWYAYTPLSDGVQFEGRAIILSRTQLIGCAIGVLGLAVLVGGVGYRVGQRRGRDLAG